MLKAREQMKAILEELESVRAQISRLKAQEEILVRVHSTLTGEAQHPPVPERRGRSPSIKPMVIDLVRDAGPKGMTSTEVGAAVKEKIPSVAKDTVGSILSRIKSDGVFVYEGDRYFDKQFAPPKGFEGLKVVG